MAATPQGTAARHVVEQVQPAFPHAVGPAALMMGLRALRPELDADERAQISILRSATLGVAGLVSPVGLAIAARRALVAAKVTAEPLTLPLHHVVAAIGDPSALATHRAICADHLATARAMGIPLYESAVSLEEVEGVLVLDGLPLVLVQRSFADGLLAPAPHWVIVIGTDDSHVMLRDPLAAVDAAPTVVARATFEGTLGSHGDSALVALYPLPTRP